MPKNEDEGIVAGSPAGVKIAVRAADFSPSRGFGTSPSSLRSAADDESGGI